MTALVAPPCTLPSPLVASKLETPVGIEGDEPCWEGCPVPPESRAALRPLLERHGVLHARGQKIQRLEVSVFLEFMRTSVAGPAGNLLDEKGECAQASQISAKVLTLDVRSPAEYARGQIPGTTNAPLFDDLGRHDVGKLYATQGKLKAIERGLELTGPALEKLLAQLCSERTLGAGPVAPAGCDILVTCWRGGMRSQSVGWFLGLLGYKVRTLQGGYKAFRTWVLHTVSVVPLQPGEVMHTASGPPKAGAKSTSSKDVSTNTGASESESSFTAESVRNMIQQARTFQSKEDLLGAIKAFTQATAACEGREGNFIGLRLTAQMQHGMCLRSLGNHAAAVDMLTSSLAPKDDLPRAAHNFNVLQLRMQSLISLGRLEDAERDLNRMTELDPKWGGVSRARKRLQALREGQSDVSIACVELAAPPKAASAASGIVALSAAPVALRWLLRLFMRLFRQIRCAVMQLPIWPQWLISLAHRLIRLAFRNASAPLVTGSVVPVASTPHVVGSSASHNEPTASSGVQDPWDITFGACPRESDEDMPLPISPAKPPLVVVLGGPTGSGKTDMLRWLARHGEQILDLEGLAHHRASAFGAVGMPPQPSQEMYENLLAIAWTALDPERRIWVEHEDTHVGKCGVPKAITHWLSEAPGGFICVDMPRALRVGRLVRDYCGAGGDACSTTPERFEQLKKSVTALGKRWGQKRVDEAHRHLETGNFAAVASDALEYYDKLYGRHAEEQMTRMAHLGKPDKVIRLELASTADADANAAAVLQAVISMQAAAKGCDQAAHLET